MSESLYLDGNPSLEQIREKFLPLLRRMEKEATVNDDLKDAVRAIIGTLDAGEWNEVADLSAVKGYVVSTMRASERETHSHHFREDGPKNQKLFGNSIYGTLDALNFQVAMALGQMPEGLVTLSNSGGRMRGLPEGMSRTEMLMREESAAMRAWLDSRHP